MFLRTFSSLTKKKVDIDLGVKVFPNVTSAKRCLTMLELNKVVRESISKNMS